MPGSSLRLRAITHPQEGNEPATLLAPFHSSKAGQWRPRNAQGGAIFLREGVHLLALDVDGANDRRALAESLEAGGLRASKCHQPQIRQQVLVPYT
jgi:hypothetical protein